MFLLDSNAWITLFRGKSKSLLVELRQRPATEIVLCPVVITELQYGVCRSAEQHRAANQQMVDELRATYQSVPFDDAAALDAAELRAQLATLGQPIGPLRSLDCCDCQDEWFDSRHAQHVGVFACAGTDAR